MKKFAAMILMMASMTAYASSASKSNADEQHGIITPDVATGMWRTSQFVHDVNMNILICTPQNVYYWKDHTCKDKNNNNAWVKMENAIPQGKKFVGFKSINQGIAHHIEIYWK